MRDSSSFSGTGTFNMGNVEVLQSSTMTITSSTLNVTNEFGQRSNNGGEAGGVVNLNGSDLSATDFFVGSGGFVLNIGGAAGTSSAVFEDWDSDTTGDQGFTVNLTDTVGNLMTMSAPSRGLSLATGSWTSTQWAQGLWENDQLTYAGNSSSDLGLTWTQATSTGLGDGNLFTFDGNTLSVAAIPEPSTLALITIAFASLFYSRRRN
jgi:hypothetical protein